ncbi:unnamed protein product [Sphenostylis stenocarpa]|uniref:Uncharacterized protein n=1 Tax=Sphenostylis stenocarpa TaxID=92480 RepID=A0AA86RYB8_9FABA|nr:unnamed protein product [Sphenostylis stenocarpa]
MSWEGAAKWVVGINEFFSSAGIVDVTKNTTRKRGATRGLPRRNELGGGRRSGLLGSTVKRMMFVHARLMKFDRVLLIGQVSSASRKIRHEKEVQHEDFPGGHPS